MIRAISSARSSNSALRRVVLVVALCCSADALGGWFGSGVNAPHAWVQQDYGQPLECRIDASRALGAVDRRIFGTNLEWFNDAGGLANPAAYPHLLDLAREQGISVFRFPGGTLADYYDWRDGTGPADLRPERRHPTDSGKSRNRFGSPELFRLLQQTGAQALITVNAGTGTPQLAADWVAYANQPGNAKRKADGFPDPAGVRLWEVGNELYLPGNPGERKITVTPEEYAQRYLRFAEAMRAVDPSITLLAIGVAPSRSGPDTQYPDWTEKLLQRAAGQIDLIAVHNAYFPFLYGVRHPAVSAVYPALWAAPEAVDRSLSRLESLIGRYEGSRHIGIAITEWGALFSLPVPILGDEEWVDHVKTQGTGVYVGRLLQVFMSHPRVQIANYFKFTDASFMGWVNYLGQPKVPYWVFELYARNTGDHRVQATVEGPTYDVPALGVMLPEQKVPEVTVVATRDSAGGRLYINFVNRSSRNRHAIHLEVQGFNGADHGEILSVSAGEPTAHEGRDIPPGWPYDKDDEPYSTAPADSIRPRHQAWSRGEPVTLPPFSVATVVIDPAADARRNAPE